MSAAPELAIVRDDFSSVDVAEAAVLAALLHGSLPAADAARAADLRPSDWKDPRNGVLYAVVLALLERGHPVDPITTARELQSTGKLAAAGGAEYIGELLDAVPTHDNVSHHVEAVLEGAKGRALLANLERAAARLRANEARPADVAESLQRAIDAVAPVDRPGAPAIELLDDEELSTLPSIAWIVDGVLPGNGLVALIGAKSTMKTFVALDLAARVQLGLEWQGRAVQPGQVVYIFAEGRSGIVPRVGAWKQHNEHRGRVGIQFIPQVVTVNEPRECARVLRRVRGRIGADTPIALIVIDTLNRCMTGNENSTEDMSAFRRGCDQLREATGATVLVIHHTGHGDDERGRGSSSFEAACDTTILCSRDADRLTLTVKKQKDGPDDLTFTLQSHAVGPSLVVHHDGGVVDQKLNGQRLHCLRVLHENSTAKSGAAYTTWEKLASLKHSSFDKARSWLYAQAYVASSSGKWRVTDSGRQALSADLRSTPSTGTPPTSPDRSSTLLHHAGGICNTPAVELDLEGGRS